MISSRIMTALLTGVVLCSVTFGATPLLERDPDIQERIDAVVTAAVEAPDITGQRVEELRQATDGRRETLIVQLALFLSDSTSTEEAMVGASLFHAFGFTADEKLAAVLPHLEAEPDSVRKVLAEILGTIDRPDGGAPDFAFYEESLRQRGRDPAAALIRYMYQVSPGAALASMTRVFGGGGESAPTNLADVTALEALAEKHDGSVPWSKDERARAGGALDRLAGDPSWWVRLYAAEMLRNEPELGTPALQGRLAADEDPLVRSIARMTPSPR
jgi:hypothetical protein